MLRNQLLGFHDAVRFGPAHCPAELFDGALPAITRGLKVHANNIAHARIVALEETYPRLLARMGSTGFHAAAHRFLDDETVLCRSLDGLGAGFAESLADAVERDLARAEWAWLQSFHAADAEALSFSTLRTMSPDELVETQLVLHRAAAVLRLEEPREFAWDEPVDGEGDHLLLSRPDTRVLLRLIGRESADLCSRLERSPRCGELLDGDPTPLLPLIEAGAICVKDRT